MHPDAFIPAALLILLATSIARARDLAASSRLIAAGATEAMARLEDDFGESLAPGQLQKDPYLRVLADKQEYLDWRASRD